MKFKYLKFKIFLFSAIVFCQLGFVKAAQKTVGGEIPSGGKIVLDTGKVVNSKGLGYDSPLKVTLQNGGTFDVKVDGLSKSSQVNVVYPDEFVSLEANSQDSKIQRIPMGEVTEDPLDQISDSQTSLSISKTNNDVGVKLQNKTIQPVSFNKSGESKFEKYEPTSKQVVESRVVKGSRDFVDRCNEIAKIQGRTPQNIDGASLTEDQSTLIKKGNDLESRAYSLAKEYNHKGYHDYNGLADVLKGYMEVYYLLNPNVDIRSAPAYLIENIKRAVPFACKALDNIIQNELIPFIPILKQQQFSPIIPQNVNTVPTVNSNQKTNIDSTLNVDSNANVEGMGGGVVLRDGVVPGGSLSEPGILKPQGMVEQRGFGSKMYDGVKYLGNKVLSFGNGALTLGGKALGFVGETFGNVMEKMSNVVYGVAKGTAKEAFVDTSAKLLAGMVFGFPETPICPVDPCHSYSSNPCDQAVNPCDFFGSDPCRSSVNDLFGSNRRTPVYDDPNQRLLEERIASGRNNPNNNQNFQNNNQNQNNNYGFQNNQNDNQRFQPDQNNNNQWSYQGDNTGGQNNGNQNSRKRKHDEPSGPVKSEDGRKGKRRKTDEPRPFKQKIETLNKVNAQFQQQGGSNPDIKNACQVVEILNTFAEYFSDSDDIDMAETTAAFSSNILVNSKGFFLKLKQSETQAFKEFFTKEHFQQQVMGALHTALYLMNELAEEQASQETFDITKLNDRAKKQYEHAMEFHRSIDQRFEQLKKMSWEDLAIEAAHVGTICFLDCVTLNLVGKSIGLLASGSKIGLAKYNELVSVKVPELARALQQENQLTQKFVVEIAGVEKIVVDHGFDVAKKTVETIKNNPGLLTQEGKSVPQVLKEISGDVAKTTPVPTTALVQEGKMVEQGLSKSGTLVGDSSILRKVEFFDGLQHAKVKHMLGDSKYSLKTLDPAGNLDKWMQYIIELAQRGSGKVTNIPTGQIMEIMGSMPITNGVGNLNMGVRLFKSNGKNLWELTTILTKQ